MHDKICVLTGATAGIGRVTAQALARQGASVAIVGRDGARGADAADRIRTETAGKAAFFRADLSDQAQIRQLAEKLMDAYPRVDVLVNNAGAMFRERRLSPDGIEMTFALNHLAYFLLTHLLLPALRASPVGRIVNVASAAHMGATPEFDDLQGEKHYNGWKAYQRSKLYNVMFTYELARRVDGRGLTVNALHPGFVATDIGISNRLVPSPLWRLLTLAAISPEQGARTSTYLSSAPELAGVSGQYFVKCRPRRSSDLSYDEDGARRLWEASEKLTGLDRSP